LTKYSFYFLLKAFGIAPTGQESTSETNGGAVTSEIDTGNSDSTRQPSLEKNQNEGIFIGGAETPVLYRSRTKLKRMAAGRLYSLEEADTLGMEEPPFHANDGSIQALDYCLFLHESLFCK
jgi:hypothetical protein